MPVPYLNKLAKETGKTIDELEKLWNRAKKLTSEHFDKPESEFGDNEFAYVTGIVKKMIGKKERMNTENFLVSKDTKIPGTGYVIKKGEGLTFVDESQLNAVKEGVDWSRAEHTLLTRGLQFNKYGIFLNNRNFEFTNIYLSSEETIFIFYNAAGFTYVDGINYPFALVAIYNDAIEDINKEKPDGITIFNNLIDAYKFVTSSYKDVEEYSTHKNSKDFWFIKKQICESVRYNNAIIINEEVRIPGTGIVLEKGDRIIFNNVLESAKAHVNY